MISIRRLATLATLSLFLAACGGGGGGSKNTPPGGNNPPTYTLTVAPASVQFAANARGALPAAQDVTATFNGEGLVVGTLPGTTLPSWLDLSVVGSPTSSPAQVRFSVTTTGTTATELATTIRFVTGKADGSQVVTKDVAVTYKIIDPLDVDVSSLDFDATAGTMAAERWIEVLGSGTDWTATSDQPWLTLSRASGANAGPLGITADATSLAAGVHTAELRLADTLSSTVITVPVTLHVAPNRWNVSRIGVHLLAFTDSPAHAAGVVVTNDAGTAATWNASANVIWLDVTTSGTNGDTLVITPNALAANLTDDVIQIATVTVSGGGLQSDTVRVGYFRSSAAEPAAVQATLNLSTSVQPAGLAIDPVRPYAYVGLSTNTVRRVNLVTGTVATLFTGPQGAKIGRVVVSGEGRYLYASAIDSTGDVLRFDLDAGLPASSLTKMTNCCAQELVWVRSRGVPLLVTGHFEVYNAVTGAAQTPVAVPVDGATRFNSLSAMNDGSEIWAVDPDAAGCASAASFRVETRPADGSGYLVPFRDSAPLIDQSTSCPRISRLESSPQSIFVQVVGQNAGGTVAYFRGAPAGPLSEIASQRHYEHLGVASNGLTALSFIGSNGAFSDGVEVLDGNNGLVHTFEQLQSMQGVRFSADDRFLVVLGNSQSAAGDLQVLRIP